MLDCPSENREQLEPYLQASPHMSSFVYFYVFSLAVFYFLCTSATFLAGELKLDASVELQRDESVRRHHDDPGDEEEQQQQGHVPARDKVQGGVGEWKQTSIFQQHEVGYLK